MQPERADAHGGRQVFEQLREIAERRTFGWLVVTGDFLARAFPGEEVDGQRDEYEEHREHGAEIQEGDCRFLSAEARDDDSRQPQGRDVGDLPADDACAGELRLGLVVGRHFRRQCFVRDDLHRVHEFEEAVGDQVVPEALALHPHEREARHQRHRQQDEKAPAAELPAQPGVVEVVGDVTDDRREERVQQARHDEDDAGLRGGEAAVGRVEEQDPDADDGHRAGAEEIVGAVGDVVAQLYFPSILGPCRHYFLLALAPGWIR